MGVLFCYHLCIPFWELHDLSPNLHIHVSVSDMYIYPRLVHIFPCSRIGRSIVGIYKPLTDTWMWCGNWDCGSAIPFLGIFVSNFRYWFFAVYNTVYEEEFIYSLLNCCRDASWSLYLASVDWAAVLRDLSSTFNTTSPSRPHAVSTGGSGHTTGYSDQAFLPDPAYST